MLSLTSPRHTSTLPIRDVAQTSQMRNYRTSANGLATGQIDRGADVPAMGLATCPTGASLKARLALTMPAGGGS